RCDRIHSWPGSPSSRVQLCFFQAEDGIRHFHVTGVQTCALPISNALAWQLLRGHAPFTTVTGDRMATAREAMTGYLPARHTFREIGRASCRERVACSGG